MDTTAVATTLILLLAALMIFGTARDLFGARQVGLGGRDLERLEAAMAERDKLRLENMRLLIQVESKDREIVALQRELSYWKYEMHAGQQGGGGSATVNVGGDMTGRDKGETK